MSPVKDRSPDLSKTPLSIGPPVEVHHPQKSPPSYPGYNNDDNVEPNLSSSSLKVSSGVCLCLCMCSMHVCMQWGVVCVCVC